MKPTHDSTRRADALILIPARDESATIGRLVRECLRAGFAVRVIDDSSGDDTAELAMQAGAEVISVTGPHHGKTAALRQGLAQMPDSIEWLFFLDGDGQHRPADLDSFWNLRHEADVIVGNRLREAGKMPFLRRWTNRLMSLLLRRSRILDSQCGYRLVRRAWLDSWLPAGSHFQFETEMALLAASRPCRVANVSIAAIYAREESRIVPWRDAWNFICTLIRYRALLR